MHDYVAAYALDALEPDESARLGQHLDTCTMCQEELANLQWIAGLLPLVDAADVERLDEPQPQPQPQPGPARSRATDRLAAEIGTSRGRRAAAVVGGAALLVAVGTLSTVASTTATARATTVNAVDPWTHVHATVTVSGRSWGTEFGLTLSGVYPHGTCSLIARSDNGRTETAATWVASPQGSAAVPGATAIPAGHLTELDVVAASGYQLVRIVVPHKTHH